jgi:hypothetical protein
VRIYGGIFRSILSKLCTCDFRVGHPTCISSVTDFERVRTDSMDMAISVWVSRPRNGLGSFCRTRLSHTSLAIIGADRTSKKLHSVACQYLDRY